MTNVNEKKQLLRNVIKNNLNQLLSQKFIPVQEVAPLIHQRLMGIPEVVAAKTIMTYLNLKNEIPTLPFLPNLFWQKEISSLFVPEQCSQTPVIRKVIIPYCIEQEIQLYSLQPPKWSQQTKRFVYNDLKPGRFGILEPDHCLLRSTELTNSFENDLIKELAQFSNSDQSLNNARNQWAKQNLKIESDSEFDKNLESQQSKESKRTNFLSKLLDVVLVPGLAFDRQGHRLGRGVGFYDRFLNRLTSKTLLIGLAFDQQLLDDIPVESHDFPLDIVVTPTQTIYCSQYKFEA